MKAYLLLTLRTERSQDSKMDRMTDRTTSEEPEPKREYQVSHRGYLLKATQNRETRIWMLSYNIGSNPPANSKFKWRSAKEALDHGKRMIDSLIGNQDY
jgi:hypothetical protein